jgi:hypothetical protein
LWILRLFELKVAPFRYCAAADERVARPAEKPGRDGNPRADYRRNRGARVESAGSLARFPLRAPFALPILNFAAPLQAVAYKNLVRYMLAGVRLPGSREAAKARVEPASQLDDGASSTRPVPPQTGRAEMDVFQLSFLADRRRRADRTGVGELDPDRSVIARLFPAANLAIDTGCHESFRHRRVEQEMV